MRSLKKARSDAKGTMNSRSAGEEAETGVGMGFVVESGVGSTRDSSSSCAEISGALARAQIGDAAARKVFKLGLGGMTSMSVAVRGECL